jgi:hypothetical protein
VYNVGVAPFYLLLVNCIRTLRQRVLHDPDFSQIKLLFERGLELPADPGPKPKGCVCLFRRAPGDTIASVGVSEKLIAQPIMLFAGWELNGQRHGVPNDGYLPVPGSLLRRLIADPTVSDYFWPKPCGEGQKPTPRRRRSSPISLR